MVPLFILMLWMYLAAILSGTWIAAIALFFISGKKQWQRARRVSGTIAVVVSLAALILAGFIVFYGMRG